MVKAKKSRTQKTKVLALDVARVVMTAIGVGLLSMSAPTNILVISFSLFLLALIITACVRPLAKR